MSDSLLSGLAQQFSGDTIGQLAGLVGGDQEQTGRAVAAALPMLLGSMTGAAQDSGGANALFGALTKDHDGSILDMLGPMLAGGYASRALGSDGGRILGHILGNKQPAVEQTVAKSAGIPAGLVQKLLPILAPIVMGYLGRRLSSGGLDAGGLGAILGGEREQVKKQDPGLGGIFDILGGGSKDDDDGDGGLMDMAGDLLGSSAGKAILGQILGR
ncbi:MAG: DUF937 domain-containing protein [Acidimicrobiia bacterium]|nr:DUF937 domain-containing protein [Acidimicrobiia bacterium]